MNHSNGFFNKSWVIHLLFSSDHFPFPIVLNKRKNISMGNCISKINKDHFFAFEEKMRNDILFFKGKIRCIIEMCARGKKYTGIHSMKKYSKRLLHYKLGCGGEAFLNRLPRPHEKIFYVILRV